MARVVLMVMLAHLGIPASRSMSVRLSGGPTRCAGRVEIQNGTWGTVCDDGWDLKDAEVVCRELGCGRALRAPQNACFGQGTGDIWLDDVQCNGSEKSLSMCKRKATKHNCEHHKDAGVVCEDKHGSASQATCTISSSKTAILPGERVTITCSRSSQNCTHVNFLLYRQGDVIENRTSIPYDTTEFHLSSITTNQQGPYRCQFQYSGTNIKSSQSDTVDITVVSLTQPSISVSSSEGRGLCPDVAPNLQGSEVTSLEVTRGYAFSILCSTESKHVGGSFSLQHSGSNRTWTQRNSSACFLFPVAELLDQGNYSCVYQVTVASRNFTSPQTHPVTVTVKASYLLPLLVAAGGLVLLILIISILLLWRCRRGNRGSTDDLNYRSNEPVEDDERDYESVDDEDKDDYVNTNKLDGRKKSLEEEEDYVNTESLDKRKESTEDEDEDYVNTETLGDTGQGLDEDEEDYVNTETLGDGQDYESMDKDIGAEDYESMDKDIEAEDYESMDKDIGDEDYESINEPSEEVDEEDYVNVGQLN